MMRQRCSHAEYTVSTRKLFAYRDLRGPHCADYSVDTRKLKRKKGICQAGLSRAVCHLFRRGVRSARTPTAGEGRVRMSRI